MLFKKNPDFIYPEYDSDFSKNVITLSVGRVLHICKTFFEDPRTFKVISVRKLNSLKFY